VREQLLPGETLIQLDGVSRRYDMGAEQIYALRDGLLHHRTGEYVGIIGTVGVGQEHHAQHPRRARHPTDGTYTLRGHDVRKLTDNALSDLRNREIGFIFQTFQLLPAPRARERRAAARLPRPLARSGAEARRALERVGLGNRMNHKPNELSGGQRSASPSPARW
jgi:putative ABC transport system ATP-binding protein